ncbi:MAG: nickel-dependent hydrogenase large subunit [Candidatus Aenigmarchaeota archaeon]|nr:nickel-dependent hydrogenase large subunit [Candidatus Aenigmarchaeota archaeon]MBU5689060.1 nickel-dependent hydrogenase large subunit [Candidatus Aenigmarchaeota archaeon]
MHKDFDINIEHISKTEGHADLEIKVRNGKVEDVKLKISENKRFYTQAIRNKIFNGVPQLVSRICGTCSIAHLTCSTEAVEKALGIQPSEQTMLLRKLTMYGMMIRDHAMHLYFFVLPDIFNKDSILEFDNSLSKWVEHAFAVKGAGNNLSKLIAGRAVHATYEQIGYFSNLPKKEDINKMIAELKQVREKVFDLLEILYNCDFKFERKTNFVALCTNDFSFLEGKIKSSDGIEIEEEDYWDYLNRVVIPYSQATGFKFEGKEYMVGASARLTLNKDALHKETKKDAKKYLDVFPSYNVYHNNLAQAIEILHSIDHSIEILETSDFKDEPRPEIKIKGGKGIGVVEAPRGTLYHMIDLTSDGKIRYGNFVIPTAQNQIKMENDIKILVEQILDKDKHEIQHEIEKLIRAYDPCMSCASHFLKIKWK